MTVTETSPCVSFIFYFPSSALSPKCDDEKLEIQTGHSPADEMLVYWEQLTRDEYYEKWQGNKQGAPLRLLHHYQKHQ